MYRIVKNVSTSDYRFTMIGFRHFEVVICIVFKWLNVYISDTFCMYKKVWILVRKLHSFQSILTWNNLYWNFADRITSVVYIRTLQDVDILAVLDFKILCFRPETPGFYPSCWLTKHGTAQWHPYFPKKHLWMFCITYEGARCTLMSVYRP